MPENAAEMVDSINAQAAVDTAAENVDVNPSMEDSSPKKTYTAEELDARIKARIDKQNAKHALDMQTLKEQVEALTKRAEEVESERDALKKEQERNSWLSEASKQTGVPADVLRGATQEEIMAHAQAIAAIYSHPVIPDSGAPKPMTVTKADILAIENEKERLAAIRDNAELFQ